MATIAAILKFFTQIYLSDWTETCMGESFQDYSWIHDFEADFP